MSSDGFYSLVQVVSDQEGGSGAGDSEAQLDLDEEVESEICKVWDMSMDQVRRRTAPEVLIPNPYP